MSKINLTDFSTLTTNETSAINTLNSNNAVLETALDNTLSRDGTSPNPMGADFDMNSHKILNIGDPLDFHLTNRIINLPDAVLPQSPVTLNQFQNGVGASGAAPVTMSFVTVNNEATLPNERKLATDASLSIADGGANASITLSRAALTGDVTASAGSPTTTIANNAVTYAKVQQVGASKILGNPTGVLANVSEIAPDTSLNFTGSTIQRSALTGDVTASAGSNATTIANNAVTYGKIQSVGASKILGNPTGSPANTSEIGIDSSLGFSGSTLQRAALTGDITASAGSNATTIPNNTVTYAKMQDVTATSRFLGRITAGAGDPEELTPTQATSLLNVFTSTLNGLVPLSGGGTTNFLRADGSWVAAGGGASGNMTRRTITTTDTIVTGDKGNIVEITSGTFTLAFTAAATLASGFWCIIYNSGTGDVTLDPNSTEQIDGLTTWVLYPGGAIIVQTDGTAFHSILMKGMRRQFDTSGANTFTKPGTGTWARIEGWGAGGSGGKLTSATGGGGGGGGAAYLDRTYPLSTFGTTETVTVGAGGASRTVSATDGAAGGNTTVGSFFTAFGGGGGGGSVGICAGGAGGGWSAAGGSAVGGTAGTAAGPKFQTTNVSTFAFGSIAGGPAGGGGGGVGGDSIYGGGAGSGGANSANGTLGGNSMWGGGGGGGSGNTNSAAGGTSAFGGAGGASGSGATNGTAGSQPGGGGGGSGGGSGAGNSGAGGDGRAIIYIW